MGKSAPGPQRRKERRSSMRWRMIGILLICWLIPFTFMIGILGIYIASNHSDMTAENFRDHLEFNNKICVERLNSTIALSRQASYDGELLMIHGEYLDGHIDRVKAGKSYKSYLSTRYLKNDAISGAFLWFDSDEGEDIYAIYNEHGGGSFQQVRSYQQNDHHAVAEYAKTLGTRIGFLELGSYIYLVRNLMNEHFQSQGTIVLCLNKAYCFSSLTDYPTADGVYVKLDGQVLKLKENDLYEELEDKEEGLLDTGYQWVGERLFVYDHSQGDSYKLGTTMILRKEVTRYPFYGYPYILSAMVLSLIPMLALMMHLFRRQVTDPVEVLSEGARHIEEGELGYQIETPLDSAEFLYLRDSFNEMSDHLKRQFDRIYQEEVALREARIMALQSHINPHFMNNTLEIINWEARLGGNMKISKMIEALSTMLDAAMDRRKRPQVRLAEEMVYVNSYLYITKERLGKRLTVEVSLPEELMDCLVPRLILQPVVENAIEHGVVPNSTGVVVIRGFCDSEYLYLETINDGGLTEEDRQRVERLLDPDYNSGKEPAGNLGIANVNQRLRIMFGEPCGLSITENENRKVVAKLTMPLQKWSHEISEVNKKEQ